MKKSVVKAAALLLALLTATFALASCGDKKPETYEYMDFSKEDPGQYLALDGYLGVTIEVDSLPAEVTDEEVEASIEAFIAAVSELEDYSEAPVDRVTQPNDVLTVDYIGTIDGATVEGFSENEASILLMEGNGYLDWFDDDLYGISVPSTVTTTGKVPDTEDYNEYAGKTVTLQITVTAISGHWNIPELTDALIAEKTVCKTVDEYREYIKASIEQERQEEQRLICCQKAWDAVMEKALTQIISWPEQQLGYYETSMRAYYEDYAEANGYEFDEFLELVGVTQEDFAEYARSTTLEDLVFFSIVRQQNLSVGEEEYEEMIKQYEEEQEMTREELEEEYGVDYIRECMLYDKVVYLLADNANVVVKEAE